MVTTGLLLKISEMVLRICTGVRATLMLSAQFGSSDVAEKHLAGGVPVATPTLQRSRQ